MDDTHCLQLIASCSAISIDQIRPMGSLSKALANAMAQRVRNVNAPRFQDAVALLRSERWCNRCNHVILATDPNPEGPEGLNVSVEPEEGGFTLWTQAPGVNEHLDQLAVNCPRLKKIFLECTSDRDSPEELDVIYSIGTVTQHWQLLQHIEVLYFGDIAMMPELVGAIQHWKQLPLQHIQLCGNQIGDEGAKQLASAAQHWRQLRFLGLGSNNIGAEGVMLLSAASQHWTQLQHLGLRNNTIGDEGAKALAAAAPNWTQLQDLDLMYCNFGASGAEHLAAAAPHWNQLRYLMLSGGEIGDEGAKHLAAAAQSWPQLRYLHLGSGEFDMAVSHLARAMQCWSQLENLSVGIIRGSSVSTMISAIGHLKQLKALDLACASGVDQTLLAGAMRQLPLLESLDVRGVNLGDGGVVLLMTGAHWPRLSYLDMEAVGMGDSGIGALVQTGTEHWPKLGELRLSRNQITDAGASLLTTALQQCWPELTDLELGWNRIGYAGAHSLLLAVRDSTRLTLRHNQLLYDEQVDLRSAAIGLGRSNYDF